jgi:uncharacterized protein YjbI with pentapeptide repeats
MTLMLGLILLGAAAASVVLYLLWWKLPKKLATSRQNSGVARTQKRADYYRVQISKALGGLLALGGFLVTVEQAITVQQGAVAARVKANQLVAYDHHQKALEALTKIGNSSALHVGAIYSLGSLAKEFPDLGYTIANELAVAALAYSAPESTSAERGGAIGAISPEAQAALTTIGSLAVMKDGLPLDLRGGHFKSARLPATLLNGVSMPNVEMGGSDLYKAHLYGANLRYANLSGSNLAGALLTNAAFYGALLCKDQNVAVSNLDTVNPVAVQFSGAKLDGTTFERAWLDGAVLGNAKNADDMDRTNLTGSNFHSASLRGTDLSYATLDGVDLRGADLTDADFTGASVNSIILDPTTHFCRTKWTDGKIRSDSCPVVGAETPAPHKPCTRNKIWSDPN